MNSKLYDLPLIRDLQAQLQAAYHCPLKIDPHFKRGVSTSYDQ